MKKLLKAVLFSTINYASAFLDKEFQLSLLLPSLFFYLGTSGRLFGRAVVGAVRGWGNGTAKWKSGKLIPKIG